MELPKPPDDPDLKNIIDKLANFVARNGAEFEQMTKSKQKDNPKFSFLFGGEHYNYYQFKVTTEHSILNQQKKQAASTVTMPTTLPMTTQTLQQTSIPPPGVVWPNPTAVPQPSQQIQQLQQQIQQLQQQIQQQQETAAQQIKQSEENLSAQYTSMIQQQQGQINEAVVKAREAELQALCDKCGTQMSELDTMAQPIIESCTKDAISGGKNWIFSHNTSQEHGDMIAQYILKRVTDKTASFDLKLHLIYLMNDVLHHCVRKNAEGLKGSFETVVTPVFCSAHVGMEEEKQQKLTKLLGLWEKNKYFSENTIQLMKDPVAGLATYQANSITKYGSVVSQITQAVNIQYSNLQKQHQEFVNHLNNQVSALQTHLTQQQAVLQQQQQAAAVVPPPTAAPLDPAQINLNQPPPGFPPGFTSQPPPDFSQPPPGFPPGGFAAGGATIDYNHGQGGPPMGLPDLSKPPPGFNPSLPPPSFPLVDTEADLMPTAPYFDLPAGLMAPLVKLEDCDYKPLDPKDIRLPPPMPPSERLLAAVEAFYSAPDHDNPRDGEGWEKLGLYEFFKAKKRSKELKEKERQNDKVKSSTRRSRSRSRSDSRSTSRSSSRSPPPQRRRYGSDKRSRSPSPPSFGKSQRSPSPRRGRSMSPSPRRGRSRSLSPRRRRSRSPPSRRGRSRTRSRTRSPTPPQFFNEPFYAHSSDSRLGQENKGHMLLKKMGWGGAGLGKAEQGIVDPIKEAEVRQNMDKFKGVGMNMTDPFEQFRKNKSAGFIQRMKARAGPDDKKKKRAEKDD
ncbi:unnamed protein product [Owenia fusiformis]|uniref:Calcium homeostasis endoplasmic reticulum protein n=1 Tax=Owenia fusiformis TaxID=6347 RepID=A0A8S4N130_OWEFU|nr:unnamed protein product [Owenia fusiformis]